METVNLTIAGDLFPANLPDTIGYGIASQFLIHRGSPWSEVLARFFTDSDISFANLESPLIEDKEMASNTCFAGNYEFTSILNKIGINIVSIANNHILEQGTHGFFSTIKHLEKNDIKYIGKNVDDNSNIVIIQIKNTKLAFAGFNAIHNIHNPNLYANYCEKSIIASINKMKSLNADFKIISLHWGDEYINIPSSNQIKSAHTFIDCGADIIIGHHPHVIQPVEKYKNGLIFYSLGNFFFDMTWSKNVRRGMVINLFLEKDKSIRYEIAPIFLNSDFIPLPVKNRKKTDNLLVKNLRKVNYLFNENPDKYDRYYSAKRRRNHLWQRILMKVFLLQNWNRLSPNTRKKLVMKIVSNLKSLY